MAYYPTAEQRKKIEAQLAKEEKTDPDRFVSITDYLLVVHDRGDGRAPAGANGPVQLDDAVTIEQIDPDLAQRILAATELAGEGIEHERDTRRPSVVVHAYVREVWREEAGDEMPVGSRWSHWDPDGRIYPAVQLSRLIRDNATSTRYAVRRMVRANGEEHLHPYTGHYSREAYRLHPDQPGWLDDEEAAQLRDLLAAFRATPSGGRIGRALNRVDRAAAEQYFEDALPFLVGGFEALVKVGRNALSDQFAERVPQVASEVGITLDEGDLRELYDDRSTHLHGAEFEVGLKDREEEFRKRFVPLCEALRAAARRALTDAEFASRFTDDPSVERHWPLRSSDDLARGLRKLLSKEPDAKRSAWWTAQLISATKTDTETAARIASAFAALPSKRGARRLRRALDPLERPDLVAEVDAVFPRQNRWWQRVRPR